MELCISLVSCMSYNYMYLSAICYGTGSLPYAISACLPYVILSQSDPHAEGQKASLQPEDTCVPDVYLKSNTYVTLSNTIKLYILLSSKHFISQIQSNHEDKRKRFHTS